MSPHNRTVALLASGPSLTRDQVDQAKAAGCFVVALHRAFQLAPDADLLLATERGVMQDHYDEVAASPITTKVCLIDCLAPWRHDKSARLIPPGVERVPIAELLAPLRDKFEPEVFDQLPLVTGGAMALLYLANLGPRRILLLGFDAGRGPNGEAHFWPSNKDDPSLANVHNYVIDRDFRTVRPGVTCPVINCSPASHLEVFPRMALGEALAEQHGVDLGLATPTRLQRAQRRSLR